MAAYVVIAEQGIEKLSLRDIARRLGVSHQAPYKHYPSRDHLLAEVMRRCFERFAQFLDGAQAGADPQQDMALLGQAYLRYALDNPLEYRLMFGTPWPSTAEHPALLHDARHSFNVLRKAIARTRTNDKKTPSQNDLDALFVWSSMHGLATIMQSNVMDRLALSRQVLKQAVPHTLAMVGAALGASSLVATKAPEPAPGATRARRQRRPGGTFPAAARAAKDKPPSSKA